MFKSYTFILFRKVYEFWLIIHIKQCYTLPDSPGLSLTQRKVAAYSSVISPVTSQNNSRKLGFHLKYWLGGWHLYAIDCKNDDTYKCVYNEQ